MNDQFYITLPSNSSLHIYGKQQPSNYRTKLEPTISVNPNDYVVGLAEISFPLSFFNIDTCPFQIYVPGNSSYQQAIDVTVEGKRYVSGAHLVREMQRVISNALPIGHSGKIGLEYDETSCRTRVTAEPGYQLFVPNELVKPLGFEYQTGIVWLAENPSREVLGAELPRGDITRRRIEEGLFPVNHNRHHPTLYVYTDLVENQRVGDANVQLLRTVNIPQAYQGELVTHTFSNIHYCALSRGVLDSVEIHIVDDLGRDVLFKHGDVITKLHFKKRRP